MLHLILSWSFDQLQRIVSFNHIDYNQNRSNKEKSPFDYQGYYLIVYLKSDVRLYWSEDPHEVHFGAVECCEVPVCYI
jgi:hypothetical protein